MHELLTEDAAAVGVEPASRVRRVEHMRRRLERRRGRRVDSAVERARKRVPIVVVLVVRQVGVLERAW